MGEADVLAARSGIQDANFGLFDHVAVESSMVTISSLWHPGTILTEQQFRGDLLVQDTIVRRHQGRTSYM
jgi:hypothetical protein